MRSAAQIRMAPGTMALWDNLRNVVERLNATAVEGLPSGRRHMGKLTNAELLHTAVDTALTALDPDHLRRHPLPLVSGAENMMDADDAEILLEMESLEERLHTLRVAIRQRLRRTGTGEPDGGRS